MRKSIWAVPALLLAGCTNSVEQVDSAAFAPPTAPATTSEREVESTDIAVALGGERANSPIDAESLLAATLDKARANDQRVIVHLGAPW